jgi:hypothetical protein
MTIETIETAPGLFIPLDTPAFITAAQLTPLPSAVAADAIRAMTTAEITAQRLSWRSRRVVNVDAPGFVERAMADGDWVGVLL